MCMCVYFYIFTETLGAVSKTHRKLEEPILKRLTNAKAINAKYIFKIYCCNKYKWIERQTMFTNVAPWGSDTELKTRSAHWNQLCTLKVCWSLTVYVDWSATCAPDDTMVRQYVAPSYQWYGRLTMMTNRSFMLWYLLFRRHTFDDARQPTWSLQSACLLMSVAWSADSAP